MRILAKFIRNMALSGARLRELTPLALLPAYSCAQFSRNLVEIWLRTCEIKKRNLVDLKKKSGLASFRSVGNVHHIKRGQGFYLPMRYLSRTK